MMYRCIENGVLYTREELEKMYYDALSNSETFADTFNDYLAACMDKNGNLEIVTASEKVYTKNGEHRLITDKEKHRLFRALAVVATMFDKIGYHAIGDELVYLIGDAKEALKVDYDAAYNETTEQFELDY